MLTQNSEGQPTNTIHKYFAAPNTRKVARKTPLLEIDDTYDTWNAKRRCKPQRNMPHQNYNQPPERSHDAPAKGPIKLPHMVKKLTLAQRLRRTTRTNTEPQTTGPCIEPTVRRNGNAPPTESG